MANRSPADACAVAWSRRHGASRYFRYHRLLFSRIPSCHCRRPPHARTPTSAAASSSSPAPAAAWAACSRSPARVAAQPSSCTVASCANSKHSTTRSSAAGHPEPTILPLDLATAKAEDFANVASALQAQHGRIDAIVHTAVQLGSLGPIEHQAFDALACHLRVNLLAPFGLTRSLLPLLRAAPDASVVFTLDTRGEDPKAYWGAYAVAKAGLSALLTILADEWENSPALRVNGVVPGPMRSPLARTNPSRRRQLAAATAGGLRAALPVSARRAAQGGERRDHRRAGVVAGDVLGCPSRSSTRSLRKSSAGSMSGRIAICVRTALTGAAPHDCRQQRTHVRIVLHFAFATASVALDDRDVPVGVERRSLVPRVDVERCAQARFSTMP